MMTYIIFSERHEMLENVKKLNFIILGLSSYFRARTTFRSSHKITEHSNVMNRQKYWGKSKPNFCWKINFQTLVKSQIMKKNMIFLVSNVYWNIFMFLFCQIRRENNKYMNKIYIDMKIGVRNAIFQNPLTN